jgi:hypothetical protein
VLMVGSARPFIALVLPSGVPSESSQLALLRLQYQVLGAMIFWGYAALYRWFERGKGRPERQRARLGFWLMLLGFNLAFLPTSWRGSTPVLVTQPDVLLAGQAGTIPLLGGLTFIGGSLFCLWTLTFGLRGSRARPGEGAR